MLCTNVDPHLAMKLPDMGTATRTPRMAGAEGEKQVLRVAQDDNEMVARTSPIGRRSCGFRYCAGLGSSREPMSRVRLGFRLEG